MSKSNVDRSVTVSQLQMGSYVVYDAPAVKNAQGQIITPVRYHYENRAPSTSKITTQTEFRSSSVTPGFSSPNRSPILLPLGFVYKKWTLVDSSYNQRLYTPGTGTVPPEDSTLTQVPTTVVQTDGYALTTSDLDALDRKAIIALRNKIKDMSINVAQAVAERHQTARTVADAATTIAKAITAVRRGDLVGAAKAFGVKKPRNAKPSAIRDVADSAANHWLALNYGWKPLLNDVYGAAEALAKSLNNVQLSKVRQKNSRSGEVNTSTKIGIPSGYSGYDVRRLRINEKCQIQYGVTFAQSSPAVVNLKSLGITNPALLAWELLPFSFVADWFVPVGNWLSSLDATLGLEFHSGYKTTFRRISGESVLDTQTFTRDGQFNHSFAYNSWQRVECTRQVLSGFPLAPYPPAKNPVSVSHAASACALLNQLFKR